jgi:hypothetical protein
MLESNRKSAFSTFSIKGNLRATIIVKKDDIYSFKKYEDLISDKKCFNDKYKSFREQLLSLKNNSLGKLDEIENPEKKHHKSKSLVFSEINYTNDPKEIKHSNQMDINKPIKINDSNANNLRKFQKNSTYNNIKEFVIENYKIKEPKENLEEENYKKDIYYSGKKIINLMNLNGNANNIYNNNNINQVNAIGNFNSAFSLKNKINLKKIDKPRANEDKFEINEYLNDYSCLRKLDDLTLLKTLEDCDIIDEIDNNIELDKPKTDLIQFILANEKKHLNSIKSNLVTSCLENALYNLAPKIVNLEINTFDCNSSEVFKTKNKKDFMNKYKKSHIESTNAPDKSLLSYKKFNSDNDSQFFLNTNENLRKIDFNYKNSENLTVTDISNIDASIYLNSVSHKVDKEFDQAFHEVKNIKKNLFLTEEEFKKDEIKLETIEKDFVDFLYEKNEKGNDEQSPKSNEKLNYIQNAIENVDLSKNYRENNEDNVINNQNYNKNYFFNFKNFKIEAYSDYKNKKPDESLTSLEYSSSKANEVNSAVKNENFIRGRSFLIESDKKTLKKYNFRTLDYSKKNSNEINLSKYKILKQDCQIKEQGIKTLIITYFFNFIKSNLYKFFIY